MFAGLFGKKYTLVVNREKINPTTVVPKEFQEYYTRYLEVRNTLVRKPPTGELLKKQVFQNVDFYFHDNDVTKSDLAKVKGDKAYGTFKVDGPNQRSVVINNYPLTGTAGNPIKKYGNTYTEFNVILDQPLVDYIWARLYSDIDFNEIQYIDGRSTLNVVSYAKEKAEEKAKEKAAENAERAAANNSEYKNHGDEKRGDAISEEPRNSDYYTILGINKSADEDAIRAAYRKRVLQTHPNKGGDPKIFIKVQEAYERLTKKEGGRRTRARKSKTRKGKARKSKSKRIRKH